MNSSSLSKHPTFLLILGAIIISFSGVWVKLADVSPSSSAFYRVFFGFIFLVFFSYRSRDYRRYSFRHLFLPTLCGLLFALDLLCWHTSILFIGPGLATLLGNFQVFILAFIGIMLLKERFNLPLIFSIPLAITGLVLIIGTDWTKIDETSKTGIYFGLATAVLYSGYILSLKQLSATTKGRYYAMMIVSFFSSIILGVYIILSGDSFAIPNLKSFFSLAGLGLFSQCLGWVLIASSLPKNKASFAGLILLLQPTLAFVWDVLFFSRPTSLINWIGVTLVLFAIYLGMAAKQK